jgi:hypothetical protein
MQELFFAGPFSYEQGPLLKKEKKKKGIEVEISFFFTNLHWRIAFWLSALTIPIDSMQFWHLHQQ